MYLGVSFKATEQRLRNMTRDFICKDSKWQNMRVLKEKKLFNERC